MKKYGWVLFILILHSLHLYSFYSPVHDSTKIIRNEKLIIKKKKGNYGVVNEYENKVIIPILYDKIKAINDDGFAAYKEDQWIIYSKEGIIISSPYTFEKIHVPIENFNENKIIIIGKPDKKSESVVVLVSNKNDYTSYKYDKILSISPSYYHVQKNGLYGTLSIDGKEVIPPLYKSIEYMRPSRKEDPYLAKVFDSHNFVGMININTGKVIIPVVWNEIIPLGKSFFKVKNGDKWGLINYNNEEILPINYTNIVALSSKFIKVQEEDGQIFFVSLDNSRGLGEDYLLSQNSYSIKQENMKFGVVKNDGTLLVPFQYDHIEDTPQRVFIATIEKRSKLLNLNGEELTENYLNIEFNELTQNFLAQDSKKRWKIINYKGEVLFSTEITNKKKLLELLNQTVEEEFTDYEGMSIKNDKDRKGWASGILAGIGTAFVYLAYALGYVTVILININYY
ncbi:hypothetical protein ETU08_08735 [Apibacter muscae]|uniref:WG repeat-containing protein n=1 Tax=Apibacter muscae TaxID=2509004 RepID=UPI0011AD1B3A|nr:WG repeat-containing protein [Apibacter muscae]TWP28520.1 hypothetical protein ETU08_08735 [Apibacter muscae]